MSDKITRDARTTSEFGRSTTKEATYTDKEGNRLTGISVTQDGQFPSLDATLVCRNGKVIEGDRAKEINQQLRDAFTTSWGPFTFGPPENGRTTKDIARSPMDTACTKPRGNGR